MKRNGLIGKKPKDARAAWRVTGSHECVAFVGGSKTCPVQRWHRAASRRKT